MALGHVSAAVPVIVPAAVVLVGAATLIAYSVNQWRSMQVPSWDLAIFSELAKDYAHFQAPIVPIKGEGFNLAAPPGFMGIDAGCRDFSPPLWGRWPAGQRG